MRMPAKTRTAMEIYRQTLPPSSARAQCSTIANYELDAGETIAERILRDHRSHSSALRAMSLVVAAGAAIEEPSSQTHCFGTFVFEDGSRSK